jgi:hypothetical protein
MQITIDLNPETAAAAKALAEARGLDLAEYAGALVSEAVRSAGEEDPALQQFDRDWAALFEPVEGLPPLDPEAFSRAALYADHD